MKDELLKSKAITTLVLCIGFFCKLSQITVEQSKYIENAANDYFEDSDDEKLNLKLFHIAKQISDKYDLGLKSYNEQLEEINNNGLIRMK